METAEKLRVDKYLWAIRIFKTRSMATDACNAGKIKLNGTNVKPGYAVKVGETYTIQKGIEKKIIKVLDLLKQRGDAKTVAPYYEDLSPVNDTPRNHSVFTSPISTRERGTGRPTKKQRRDIDKIGDD